MALGHFRFGYRTFKTSLAVALCLIVFWAFIGHSPVIACLSAVVAMREDMSKTYAFGGFRILGTLIGGLTALIYYFLQNPFTNKNIPQLIFIPILIGLIIIVSDGFNFNKGIIASTATFLIIVLTIPHNESYVYILQRTLDSFIGVFISLAVNLLIKAPPQELETALKQEEKLEEENIAYLKERIKQLEDELDNKKNSSQKK